MSYDAAGYDAEIERRIRLLAALREDPAGFDAAENVYANDPVEFIADWGWTYDPRNVEVGLPATIPFLLFPVQRRYIEWLLERWLARSNGMAEKSRDMGASWLAMAFACWMWRFKDGTSIGVGSRKEVYVDSSEDPKSLFWMARKFIDMLPAELKPRGYSQKVHATFCKIINPANGASIVGEAGDNIGRGARTSLYLVDESAFLERPVLVDASLSSTTNCRIDISTPNGPLNPFAIKRRSGNVSVFTLHWRDDPRKSEEWYAKKCLEINDKQIIAQEIDINYEASTENALIPGELVEAAQKVGKVDVSPNGLLILSIDVARGGKCETVMTLRRGRAVLWQKVSHSKDTRQIASAARAEVMLLGGEDKVGQIAVDDIGVGGGVTDSLREWFPRKGFVVGVNNSIRVDDGIHYNIRAQSYGALADWLADAPVSLPNDPTLKFQLCSIKKKYKGGVMLLEHKKEMTGAAGEALPSPDRADSLALGFAIPPVPLPKRKRASQGDYGVLDPIAGF